MSLDLDVSLTREITIKDLLFKSREELIKLTQYNDMPYIQALQLKEGKRIEIDEKHVLKPNNVLCLKFQNTANEVYVTVTEIQPEPPYISEAESGITASVSMNGNDVLKYFLVTGIALSLSNYCNTDIYDERRCWSKERINTYDKFCNELKINIDSQEKKGVLNIETVCELFYANLRKHN